jgi:Flp pilus assembly protein TadG
VALEFAVIFPVFLFMVLFMLDAGRYLIVQMALNNAAEVGARYVAMSTDLTTTTGKTVISVPDAVMHLATLDNLMTFQGSQATEKICPIGAENAMRLDRATGLMIADPFGACNDVGASTCAASPANWRAVVAVSVSFQWITPLGLILNLARPEDLTVGNSDYFTRPSGDSTVVQGLARQLCQN